jgi:Mg-chelatase subunit ChlD
MSYDNSTVATTASMETESFVNVDTHAALSVSVLPKNDVIGMDAMTNEQEKITTTEICVSIKARDLPDNEDERAPVDIIVALDVSGSMSGQKLHLCKRTLDLLLRVLLPQDRFGLVSYGSDARLEIPARHMTADNKQVALQKISALTTCDRTNISAAIGLATQEMRAIEMPNDVRSIFLLTDGLANEGISDRAGLVELTKNCLDNSDWVVDFGENLSLGRPDQKMPAQKSNGSPISFHTFGYGLDHDAALLCEMASATGSYYFVEDDKNVGSAFGDALGGILSVVAQNAVVTIKVSPEALALGVGITEVLHDQAVARENGSYTVTVGDFYAEEERDVVFQVKLATLASPPTNNPIPHAMISLAYTDTLDKRLVQSDDVVVCTIVRPSGAEISKENPHVVAQSLRVYAAQEMAETEKLASEKRFDEAKLHMQRFRGHYAQQSAEVQALSTAVFRDSCEAEEALDDQGDYERKGAQMMYSRIRSHQQQRSAPASMDGNVAYTTKRKAAFSSLFVTAGSDASSPDSDCPPEASDIVDVNCYVTAPEEADIIWSL